MNRKWKKAAKTGGLFWGGMMLVTTLASVYYGYGTEFLKTMASIYPGYSISLSGSLVGFVYGFADVYFGVCITNWIYKKVK